MHQQLVMTSRTASQPSFSGSVERGKNCETLILDPDGHVCSWNVGLQSLFGYEAQDIIGQHFSCFFPPEAVTQDKPVQILAIATTGDRFREEGWYIHQDGSHFLADVTVTALRDTQGHLRGFAQVIADLTSPSPGAALQESYNLMRSILESTPDAVLVKDLQGRYVMVNPAAASLLEKSIEEIVGQDDTAFFPLEIAHFLMATDQQVMSSGMATTSEDAIAKDGQLLTYLSTKSPWRDDQGQVIGLICISRDVSEAKHDEVVRKRTEHALRDQVRLTAFRADVDAFLTRNDDLQDILHQCTEAIVDHLDAAFARIWLLNPQDNVLELQASSGLYTHLDGPHARVPVGQFKIGLIAEERQPHLTNTVLDDPRVGDKAWAQREGMVAFAGYPLIVEEQLLGVIAMFARKPLSVSTLDALAFVSQEIALGVKRKQTEIALRQSETRLREKAQQLESTLWELQQTQTQIVQSEKMSSLGQLVAGIAHEINNPVNFIYGNLKHANEYTQDLLGLLQLYQQHYPQPVTAVAAEAEAIDLDFLIGDLPKLLSSMKVGADRIRQIVVSLRNFSRMDETDMKPVDIHEGIDSTLMILQHRLKTGHQHPAIQLVKNYGDIPLVECYAGQLNQVFMNILSNAIDALEEQDPQPSSPGVATSLSQICISTEKADSDRVRIRIADNGPGLSAVVKQHLFDPFFTTKPVGKGTGLGMSISYQIVTEKHGGSLHCVSEPGQGAEFMIEIPITQKG
ncbi:MAG TPA: PAS domain-containing protein [Allocoleopsis sp.]